MLRRKGVRSQRIRQKTARYAPYGRPRTSEAPRSGRSRTAHFTGVPTGLAGKLLGKKEEKALTKLPQARTRSFEAETPVENEYSMQYAKDIEDDDPVDYDALPEETTKGVPSADDLLMWAQPAAEFIRSGIGLIESADDWIGKCPLGEGGFGLAGLWERIGMDGNPVDVSGRTRTYSERPR